MCVSALERASGRLVHRSVGLTLELCDSFLDSFKSSQEGLADLVASIVPQLLKLLMSTFGMAEKCGYIDSRVAFPFVD